MKLDPFFLAKACCASYISPGRCFEELLDHYRYVKHFETPGACAYVAFNFDGSTLFVFRGSDQIRDLLGGAWSFGLRWHVVYHRMFLRLMHAIDPQLLAHPEKTVITGHSQGGAFALFASLLINPAQCVTFGCPAVFGRLTLHKYSTPTLRYVHGNDIVPSLFPGYQHVGKVTRLAGSGGKIEDHAIIEYVKAMR